VNTQKQSGADHQHGGKLALHEQLVLNCYLLIIPTLM